MTGLRANPKQRPVDHCSRVSADQLDALYVAFGRDPDREEAAAGEALVAQAGLVQLCRMMLAANEFSAID